MVEQEFKINQVKELWRICHHCGVKYRVGVGGQKSGMSPGVHIAPASSLKTRRLITGEVIGFCSPVCLSLALGADVSTTLAYKALQEMGIDPMTILDRP